MSCIEKHALLLKYKLYVNAVVAELAGLAEAAYVRFLSFSVLRK